MKRSPMPPRKVALRRTMRLKPVTKIRPVNPERKARRFANTYHSDEFVAWIHSMPCCVPGCDERQIEATHIRSRGAGGKWEDVVPMGAAHHRELHQLGIRTFSAKYGIDLPIIARVHAAVWRERMGDLPASEPGELTDPDRRPADEPTDPD